MTMPTETTPYMGLILPVPLMTAGPGYAYLLDAAQYIIDSHDHSPGKGVLITPAGMNISSDLSFVQNNATNLRTARLYNNTTITLGVNDKTAIYALNGELYYVDGSGNIVQITLSGALDLSGGLASLTIKDSSFTLEYFGDTTRKAQFSLAAVPASTTNIYALPALTSGTTDTLVTDAATQTLTNKTLSGNTAVTLISGSGTLTLPTSGTVTVPNGTDTLVNLTGTQTLTGKTLTGNTAANLISGSGELILNTTGTITVPNVAGTDFVTLLAASQTLTNKTLGATTIQSAAALSFNNSANTFHTSLAAGANTANYAAILPIADGSNGQVLQTNGSGQWSWTTAATTVANVAANDSNVTFTNASARFQDCTPTAARTYTMATTGIPQGDTWTFFNNSAFLITVQSSGANTIGYVFPHSTVVFIAQVATPTTAANWLQLTLGAQLISGNISGNAPSAGFIGEQISSTVSTFTNFPNSTSGIFGDMTSITLSAGIWDVTLMGEVFLNTATGAGNMGIGIGTASGTSSAGLIPGVNNLQSMFGPQSGYNSAFAIPSWRSTLSSSTTYYAKAAGTWSTGIFQYVCRLSATRVG